MTANESNSPLTNPPADYCPEGTAKWFTVPDGLNKGAKIFYADYTLGKGEPEATIVLVHGGPECSYSYRHVIDQLEFSTAKTLRIVVMDHIGFGRSDQATFEMVDMHHAHNLKRLIQYLDLRDITLVVHDWGGPIGIGAVIEEPERVSNLVLLNTTIFPLPPEGMTYTNYPSKLLSWNGSADYIPTAMWGTWAALAVHSSPSRPSLGILANTLRVFLMSAFNKLPATWNVYKQMLSTEANVKSNKRFVRHTAVWGHGYRYDSAVGVQDNHEFYELLQGTIGEKWGPQGQNIGVRIVFGALDPLAKPSVVKQWVQALPQVRGHVQIFPRVSHFVAEHKGAEIARAIIDVTAQQMEDAA